MGILNKLLLAGTATLTKDTDEHLLGIVKGINLMSVVITSVNIIFGIIYYLITDNSLVILGCLLEATVVGAVIWLNSAKKYQTANLTFFFAINIATLYFSGVFGQAVQPQLIIIFLIAVSLFAFEGLPALVFSIGFSILMLVLIEANYKVQYVKPIAMTEIMTLFLRCFAYVICIPLVMISFYLYAKNKKSRLVITQKNLAIEEQKGKDKTEFIRNISHEVRNPLNGIFGIAQYIMMEIENDKESKLKEWYPLVNTLMAASNNLKRIISDILNITKIEENVTIEINNEHLQLRTTIQEVVDICTYNAHIYNVNIIYMIDDTIPVTVISDRKLLDQILNNLISNAVKFATPGTDILVYASHNYDCWALKVTNKGLTIPKDRIEKIFDLYVTKSDSANRDGSGIGLHVVKQNAHLLGGQISVASENEATTFTLILPYNLPTFQSAGTYIHKA